MQLKKLTSHIHNLIQGTFIDGHSKALPTPMLEMEIKSITSDSRQVKEGTLFVAVRGLSYDAHHHLEEIFKKKPSAVIVEDIEPYQKLLLNQGSDAFDRPVFLVANSKVALNHLAHAFYNLPADQLFMVGVTGTNGKTSVCHMVEHILNGQNIPTGVMGTIDHHLKGRVWSSDMTTPNTVGFYSRLNEFLGAGAQAVAMEVSSHALKQKRIDEVPFDVAVFTNLSRDHLDYHQDMDDYFHSKEILFKDLLHTSSKKKKFAVLNADDPRGLDMDVTLESEIIFFTENAKHIEKEVLQRFPHVAPNRLHILEYKVEASTFQGMNIVLNWKHESVRFQLPVIGRHNAANAAAALGAGLAKGLELSSMAQTLQSFFGARGRLEAVPNRHGIYIFVDYAHTDDALTQVLKALNGVRSQQARSERGRILTVFGCGGDRDKGKRPLMGAVAASMSDEVILTSDNPRTEEPLQIIRDILEGLPLHAEATVEVDRRKAIHLALEKAQKGDVVLIAGKGHEDYQIVGKEKKYFDDVQVAKEFFHGMAT